MTRAKRYLLPTVLLASSALLTVPGVAGAQTAPATVVPAPQESEAASVDDIIVTARKRDERIQDVPVAITALNSEALERRNATTLTDLSGLAPSVSLQNFAIFPFNLTAVIRGIGTADFEPSSDPAVALFIDGVYQPSSNGAAVGLLDTESVELLRGPQGTLFGRNATAGAILIRTKRPSQTFGVEAQATVGNYGQADIAAAVSGPIVSDVLAYRLSASSDNLDGYFDNIDGRQLGAKEVVAFRPSLLFTPNDRLTVYLTGEYVDDTSDTVPGINGLTTLGGAEGADEGDYNTTVNESMLYKSLARSVTLNADYDTDVGTFSLIGNYRNFRYRGTFDVDASPVTLLAVDRFERHEQRSVEGRFASDFEGPFQFVAGVSYLEHDYLLDYNGRSAALIPGLPPAGPGLAVLTVSNGQQSQTTSIYFQGSYEFTERLSVDFGVNYGRETKDFDFNAATVFFVPAAPSQLSETWSNTGPKLGVNYKVSPDVLLYGSYSRGFRSGGFSGRAFSTANLGPYEPEVVDAYEVGLKSDLFDRRLRLNLSAFNNEYQDLQRPFPNLVGYNGTPPNPLELITFNAAGATISGAEIEATWTPVEGLTLQGSLAYLDAKYDGFIDPAGGGSLDNLKLVYAPEWDGRIAAIYRRPLGDQWYGEISADYQRTSELETDTNNATVGHRDATGLVNASVTIGQEAGGLSLTAFGKNLTEEVYVVSAQAGAPFFNIFTINAPRTYGLTLRYRY